MSMYADVAFQEEIFHLRCELELYRIEQESLLSKQFELEDKLAKYINMYDIAPVGHFILNKDGLIIDVNETGVDLIGKDKTKILNRCFIRFIHLDFQLLFSQYRQYAIKNRIQEPCKLKLLREDKPAAFVKCEGKVCQNDNMEETFLVTITDISMSLNNKKDV